MLLGLLCLDCFALDCQQLDEPLASRQSSSHPFNQRHKTRRHQHMPAQNNAAQQIDWFVTREQEASTEALAHRWDPSGAEGVRRLEAFLERVRRRGGWEGRKGRGSWGLGRGTPLDARLPSRPRKHTTRRKTLNQPPSPTNTNQHQHRHQSTTTQGLPTFEHDRAKADRESTTMLSPWIHAGGVSVRHVYYRVAQKHAEWQALAAAGGGAAGGAAAGGGGGGGGAVGSGAGCLDFVQQLGYREYSR